MSRASCKTIAGLLLLGHLQLICVTEMAVPTSWYGHFCDGNVTIFTSLLFFLILADILYLFASWGLKGPLRMPTGQRQKIENKPAPIVSDEVALVIYAALLAVWIGCLLWSSLASHLPTVPRILAWDKLQHFFAYAVLMFFSGHFFKLLIKKRQKGWIIGFIFTVGFGLLMEIGQKTFSSSRQADWKDLVANTLGAGLVLVIALLTKEKRS